MIKILITFDYEIPLGKVNSFQKGLFSPSDRIIDLGKRMNVPFVFFADIYSAIRFQKWDNKNYYQPFYNQINKAINYGHDVQLHIHPHWLTSTYEKGIFHPSKDYSLGDFENDKDYSIESIIKNGIEQLSAICKQSNKNYKCIAFRAGGYSILKSSKSIIESLIKNDIKIDSSILPQYFVKAPSHTIEFKSAPKNTWHIDPNQDIYKDAKTGLWEVPISNMPINVAYIAKRRMRKLIYKKRIASDKYDNTGTGLLQGKVNKTLCERLKFFKNPLALSFDNPSTTLDDLINIVDYNIKKNKNNSITYLTTISHPKFFGDYNLALLRDFILYMRNRYSDDVEFITYSSIAQQKENQ